MHTSLQVFLKKNINMNDDYPVTCTCLQCDMWIIRTKFSQHEGLEVFDNSFEGKPSCLSSSHSLSCAVLLESEFTLNDELWKAGSDVMELCITMPVKVSMAIPRGANIGYRCTEPTTYPKKGHGKGTQSMVELLFSLNTSFLKIRA